MNTTFAQAIENLTDALTEATGVPLSPEVIEKMVVRHLLDPDLVLEGMDLQTALIESAIGLQINYAGEDGVMPWAWHRLSTFGSTDGWSIGKNPEWA